jgi:selenocysteine lyase/cysteine desulfurase
MTSARGHEGALGVEDAQELWSPVGPFLNTASYGLPPRPAFDALQQALAEWRGGRTSWEHWADSTDGSRAAFARLVGVGTDEVAIGTTVSELTGLVAASLPDGARVLSTEIEFTSMLFPFMVHAERGVEVRTVPVDRLAEAIDAETTIVAFSAVQSTNGEVADLDAIIAAARHHGAMVAVDGTQACGWLPIDAGAVDFLACAAYKWLSSPRGTAFLTVKPEHLDSIRPLSAGWYAGEDPHASYYGPPLRLARSTRRLDTSPAWFSWVGTQPAIELVEQIGVESIHAHDVALANRFRAGLGLEDGDSAIVAAEVEGAEQAFERAGVQAAVRSGSLRASFHVYNTEADVDEALTALAG